ncbi:MAG: hypothetical protein HYZ75_07390 [Elusimicrobia bacterium]|nr:hypothetical protein [Elusimicrobiota bacterium]
MDFAIRKDVGRRVKMARPQREQDAEELAYWLSRPSEERIEAGAFMTRRLYWLTHGAELPPLDKTVGRRVPRRDA